jgi:hypothetical protein
MARFTVERNVNAPRMAVWEALADFGNVHAFHPMIKKSRLIDGTACGLGAKRVCEMPGGMGKLEEEAVAWDEGRSMKVAMLGGNVPVRTMEITLTLAEERPGVTRLRAEGEFTMKYGVVGWLMTPVMRVMFGKMMRDLFVGVERHVTHPVVAAVGAA